ncbi:murein L,D-transpeptidase [Thalassotalea insulae]|uniref:Murein L,D-transpeptidase n=1 Tax=Thalassotalea insulae TaxID=2056778 RepID=A0ABQ6GUF5_9GAMM|nr:L,D-transpeptidase family protein [Thalassotalea insulae]GLX79558.1 murein L,D-transpeptidase [Thalassotalea insulae]
MKLVHAIILFLLMVERAYASVYPLPADNSRLLGEPLSYQVETGDYFQALAEYHDVGLLALMAANPEVDPFLPAVGSYIQIPKQMLLPFAERKGIVVNLSELRLYYFPPGESLVYVFPVGIGREGLATPKVISHIGDKRKDPVWRPTKAYRQRYFQEHGKTLPKEIPAGPNNPFGKYALRIDTSEYLIHGTNQRMGIGMRASSGCIRMYAPDIEWLYFNVPVGTQIRIVDQAIKMSYEPNGAKLIEVHQPLSEQGQISMTSLPTAVNAFIGDSESARIQLSDLLSQPSGLVVTLEQ